MLEYRFTILGLECEACMKMCTLIAGRLGLRITSLDLKTGAAVAASEGPADLKLLRKALGERGYELVA